VQARWFGLFRVRSPLLAESLTCFLFLQVLRWFTSLGCLLPAYGFSGRSSGISLSGLPHSEILGSKPVCGSPKLIAAYHVLHRLLAPRHSPYALSSLTIELETDADSRQLPAASSQQEIVLSLEAGSWKLGSFLRQFLAHCMCVVQPSLACARRR
jgi:hypothetical protein